MSDQDSTQVSTQVSTTNPHAMNNPGPTAHDPEQGYRFPNKKSGRGPSKGSVIGFGVLAVGLAIWGIVGRLSVRDALAAQAEQAAIPTVAIATVTQATAPEALVLPGSVQAFADAPIYARTSGYLKKWDVDIGARVKTGDLLAEIDTPEVDQQLRQAEADLKTAQANEALAKSTADRWQAMLKTQAVSQQDTDQKLGDYAAKHAATESAVANVQRLRDTQGFKRVVAPFTGTITARHTDIGQLVNSASGVELFHIADTRKLRVYVQVPQMYATGVKTGQSAEITFADHPGMRYPAQVVGTSDALDATTRTLQVQLQVDNGKGELYPGAYGEVHLNLPVAGVSLRVPANSLLFGAEGLKVASVNEQGQVTLKSISVGRDFGTELEVVAGIEPGEHLIINPPDSIANGATVRISKSADKPATGSSVDKKDAAPPAAKVKG